MSTSRHGARIASLFILASAASACGDGGSGNPNGADRFSVAFVAPTEGALLFPDTTVAFEAVATPLVDDLDVAALRYAWSFGDGESATTSAPTTEHVFDLDGEYSVTVTVEELDDDGQTVVSSEFAVVQLDVLPPADLRVGAVTVSLASTTVTANDTVRASFDITADGAAGDVPVPFTVAAYYVRAGGDVDTTRAPDPATFASYLASGAATEVATRTVDSLEAGSQVNVDFSAIAAPEGLPSGDYAVLVYVDTEGVIGEADKVNNAMWGNRGFTWVNTTDIGPDLLASDIVARPARVNALSSVTLDAAIRNVGNQPALLFNYTVWLSAGNTTLDEGDTRLGSLGVNNVSPDIPFALDDVTLPVEPAITALGEYYVLIEVDSDQTVNETDETNNVGTSQRILVTDEPVPGVDIVIDAFEVAPRNTFVAGSVDITATIRNQGTSDIDRQSFCRIHVSPDATFEGGSDGDRALDSIQVPPLVSGEATEITRVSRIPTWVTPGDYVFFLDCDPTLAIAEADESNNLAGIEGTVSVASEANVELVARSFTVAPDAVDNEGLVAVSVEICNEGSNGSTPSSVKVHISTDGIFDVEDTVLLQSRVPPLDPDACVTISADVPAICDTFESSYTVFAHVDAGDDVPELDETNNIVEHATDLVINGLICDCELDRFEPNDSIARAAYLNPGAPTYTGLSMCDLAVDWYRIPLLRGESVRVAITFDDARGNLDMVLYGTDRSSVLASSATDGDREEVSFFVAPQSGDYYLKVAGRNDTDRNVYDLTLDVSARATGTDLIVVNPTLTNTTPVLGQQVDVTFDAVNLGDVAAGASVARFYYSTDVSLDTVADALVGELALDAITDRLRRTATVTLPDDVEGGESYIIALVDARDDVAELDEDNNVGVTPRFELDALCYDALEPNNDIETPVLLDAGTATPWTFSDLLACSSNRDFYEVCAGDGEYLDLTVTFDDTVGDIDIKLYDELGAEVDRSESVGPEESVGVDYVAGDRCYRLEVYVAGRDREVAYQLSVDRGAASDELACSRLEEPNDDFSGAVDLRNFLDEPMAVCPVDDSDFFRLPLTAGSDVTLRLESADGLAEVPSQLRLALFSPSRNFITNTVSATETINYRVALTGNHYVRVRSNGDGPRSQGYRVVVEGVAGVDLIATDLLLEPGVAGPGDEVRFSYAVSNTRSSASTAAYYAVYLSEDDVLDTAEDLLVRELDLPAIPAFGSSIEGRRFNVPTALIDGGLYWVFVMVDSRDTITEFGERNNSVASELVVTARCAADLSEPNNFSFEAYPADDAVGLPLSVCSDDVDWFSYTIASPRRITASIDFEHANGDLDLYVFSDPTGDPVAFSDGITDGESVSFTAAAGTYYFRVDSFYRESNTYTFSIE